MSDARPTPGILIRADGEIVAPLTEFRSYMDYVINQLS